MDSTTLNLFFQLLRKGTLQRGATWAVSRRAETVFWRAQIDPMVREDPPAADEFGRSASFDLLLGIRFNYTELAAHSPTAIDTL